jgi:SAM-dependent methyltransferase
MARRSELLRRANRAVHAARVDWRTWPAPVLPANHLHPAWPNDPPEPTFPGLVSQACTDHQCHTPAYRAWADRLRQDVHLHRKQWEWCFIGQALEEAGVIRPGASGIGFGVGTEPLTAWFAANGCRVLATDHPGGERAGDWSATGELAHSLADLNAVGICDPDEFERLVRFRPVDMRALPELDERFDFAWSSCVFEHLGSIEDGLAFLEHHLELLAPGGVAVHTTELNVSSTTATIDHGPTVLYRRSDLESLTDRLAGRAEVAPLNFHLGSEPNDRYISPAHGYPRVSLRYPFRGFVTTSFGLILRKSPDR